jgi:hypothetical protein
MKPKNHESDFAFQMTMKLGGSHNYSDSTKSQIWAECLKPELRNQALMYLSGSSERAPMNLQRLHDTIVEKFFTHPVTGEVTL